MQQVLGNALKNPKDFQRSRTRRKSTKLPGKIHEKNLPFKPIFRLSQTLFFQANGTICKSQMENESSKTNLRIQSVKSSIKILIEPRGSRGAKWAALGFLWRSM